MISIKFYMKSGNIIEELAEILEGETINREDIKNILDSISGLHRKANTGYFELEGMLSAFYVPDASQIEAIQVRLIENN